MMMPNPQIRPLLEAVQGMPAFSESSPAAARELLAKMSSARPSVLLPAIGGTSEITIPGPVGSLRMRHYRPTARPLGTVIYLHGGGWVLGDLDTSDALCRVLVHSSGCELFSVDYRLAPEFPFPAALEDTFTALRWAGARSPEPLFVAGDSAGGNLAAAAALRARAEGGPALAGQILFYPVLDHDFSTSSYQAHGSRNLVVSTQDMRWYWQHYLPNEAERADPLASPLRAENLGALPAAFIVAAGLDPLCDEALAYARRLHGAGVAVQLLQYDDMVHGFLGMIGFADLPGEVALAAGRWIHVRAAETT